MTSTFTIFIGAIQKRIGHRLADPHTGDPPDGVVQRLEMLDVDRSHHADAVGEQLEDVLVTLFVPAAWHVGVCRARSTTHICGLRARIASTIHLFEYDAAIIDTPPRHHLQISDLCFRILPSVGLDEANDDVDPLSSQHVRILQQRIGLPHPWRRTDVHA